MSFSKKPSEQTEARDVLGGLVLRGTHPRDCEGFRSTALPTTT